MVNAQINMKALVVSRLMLGDISNWGIFESQRAIADRITNRRAARSALSRTGHKYNELSMETQKFIQENFVNCKSEDFSRLCDEIKPEIGFSVRLDEFEKTFFLLAASVKRRVPFYAHVHISIYGMQFEFPEHHFLRDIETSLPELMETQSLMAPFRGPAFDSKRDRKLIAGLIAREKFLSRSIVSAAFSLIESFLSGLFFTAVHTRSIGQMLCDDMFLEFSAKKESAPLKTRLDRMVRFTSMGTETGDSEPFNTLIVVGKHYRDAIHHTTPFQRKDIELGGRLSALYEINNDTALCCIVLSTITLLKISFWINGEIDNTDITTRCEEILQKATAAHLEVKL